MILKIKAVSNVVILRRTLRNLLSVSVFLAAAIFAVISSAQPSCTLTNAYFSLDDDGQTIYPTGTFVPRDVHVFLVVEGQNCPDGTGAVFVLYDTDDGVSPAGSRIFSPDPTAQFYRGKAIAQWTTAFAAEPGLPDSSILFTPQADHIFVAESGSATPRTSNNYIVVSSQLDGICGNGFLGVGNTDANPWEACDASASGGFDRYPQFPGAFYDSQNRQPGFSGGYRVCTGTGSDPKCGISLKNACKLESAAVTKSCTGPGGVCVPGDVLTLIASGLKQTKPINLRTDSYNCDFRTGIGHSLILESSSGSCRFVVDGYDATKINVIGQERNNVVITGFSSGPYYEWYNTITAQWTVPAALPPGCSGQTLTSGKVHAMTQWSGSVVSFANASASFNIQFPLGCSVSDVYFASDAAGNNKIPSGTAFANGASVYLVVDSQNCAGGAGNNYQLDMYDTDDGTTTDGLVQSNVASGIWSQNRIIIPYTAAMNTGDTGDGAFSGGDSTVEFMFRFVNAQNSINMPSTNYIEITPACSAGEETIPIGQCASSSGSNRGKLCQDSGGVPALVENCPACSCGGGYTCGSGISTVINEDFPPTYDPSSGTKQNFNSAASTIDFSSGEYHNTPNSLQFTMNSISGSGSYAIYYYRKNLTAGTYNVQAWVKTSVPNFGRVYIKPASAVGGPNEQGATLSSWHTGDNTWQMLTLTYTALTSTEYILALQIKGSVGTAYFDEIVLGRQANVCIPFGSTCSLNAVSITPQCGGTCGSNENISISAQYSGVTCPVPARIQVDARDAAGTCIIEMTPPPGGIAGMSTTCSGSPCTGRWLLPNIPAACIGKTVDAISASIRSMGGVFYASAVPTGSFTFIGGVSLSSVSASPLVVALGTPVTMTSSGAAGDSTTLYLECGDRPITMGPYNLCTKTLRNSLPSASPQCTFNAPWTGDGVQNIYCRVLDNSTGFYSSERSTTVTRDNTGFPISIISPPANSWQRNDFSLTVNWVGASACYIRVESNGLLTRSEEVSCTTPDVLINVGSLENCRDQGAATCKVTALVEDDGGLRTNASRTFSIDWTNPTGTVSHIPSEIGAPTFFTITAQGSDANSGLYQITINVNGTNATVGALSPVTYTANRPAGTSIQYFATIADNAGNTFTTPLNSFNVCKLQSISVGSCPLGGCKQGDALSVNAVYSGACPSTSYIQIDARSDDGTCTIQAQGGSMSGIQLACTSGSCSGQWLVPQVPNACWGKRANLTAASLYAAGFPPQPAANRFDSIVPTGRIDFGYPAGSCSGISNMTCDSNPANRPLFCNNGNLINNATACGCPFGDFYMNVNNDCVIAACGSTAFETCELQSGLPTGFYCTGIPAGNNVYTNVSLVPNTGLCGCPPGQQPVSKPYITVFTEGFETGTLPQLENRGGSAANAGIFSPGLNGLFYYLIDKTNAQGNSRGVLSVQGLEIGETYTVTVWVRTSKPNFAKIYDLQSGESGLYHSGDDNWRSLTYTFTALANQHNIAMQVESNTGQAYFDVISVQKHEYVCTAICIDGTPVGECSSSMQYGQPYECRSNNPIPQANAARCGCPEGQEPDVLGRFCVPASCADGTPHDECSIINQGYFCSSATDNLTLDEAQCGCREGYGRDIISGACIDCRNAQSNNPPTGGYAKCELTNGTLLSNITVSNATCNVGYQCICPNGTAFDLGFGCVELCNSNNICEPFESVSTCPNDCPIGWTDVSADLTETGVKFDGSLALTFQLAFRSCNGNASIAQCKAINYATCSINKPCYCGDNFNSKCEVKCSDRTELFYLLGEGPLIQGINTRNVVIASPIQQFSCPVFNIPDLQLHLANFWSIEQGATIKLAQAFINLQRAGTDEERDYWQLQIDIAREILIVVEAHIKLLQDVIENPTRETVDQAFELTEQKYDEVLAILGGSITTMRITAIDFPEVVQVPQGQNGTASIDVTVRSAGNATRWIAVNCLVQSPSSKKIKLNSTCIELLPDTTDTVSFDFVVAEYGAWPITSCELNVSTLPTCAFSQVFASRSDVGQINVTTLPLLRIKNVQTPGELSIGEPAIVKVTVENIDSMSHRGFVKCNIRNPNNNLYTVTSANKTVSPNIEELFTPNRTVDLAGTWTVESCTVFRIGSIIDEGTFVINNNFEVGPAQFSLTPESATGAVGPGESIDYNIVLKNLGIDREIYDMELTTTNNWTASYKVDGSARTSTQLNAGQSSNITLTVEHTNAASLKTVTGLTVTSRSGRTKSSVFTTNVSIPNNPPEINVDEIPDEVKSGATVTFSAVITDADNDTIRASVCIGNCNKTCPLSKSGNVYTCNYAINLSEDIYNYFVNATDGEDIVVSDAFQFTVVPPDFCRSASDCPSGKECRDNLCKEILSCPGTNAACYVLPQSDTCGRCGTGFQCVSNVCQPAPECNRDTDCDSGEVCQNLKCVVSFTGPTCRTDNDCIAGFRCVDGSCEEKPEAGDNTLFIVTVVIIIIAALVLFLFIRRRWEEEEEYE